MAKGTLALRQIKLGDNADNSKNFLISVPAVADGTLVIERGDGTDVLRMNAAGLMSLPQMSNSFTAKGHCLLPNGLMVQWGSVITSSGGVITETLSTEFPNVFLGCVPCCRDTDNSVFAQMKQLSLSSVEAGAFNTANARVATSLFYLVWGY